MTEEILFVPEKRLEPQVAIFFEVIDTLQQYNLMNLVAR